MNQLDRKEAVRQYKEQPPSRGVFAVTCVLTGSAWVGASRNLHAAENGLMFLLRHGQHRDRALQAEWRDHGEVAFRFEVVEKLDADLSAFILADTLKEKTRDWAARLRAATLLP